jgi:hypothetical protein
VKTDFPDPAVEHTRRSLFQGWYAEKLAREWTPAANDLIRAVRGDMSWLLGPVGYKTAAKLVGAALDRPVTRWGARRAVKSFVEK